MQADTDIPILDLSQLMIPPYSGLHGSPREKKEILTTISKRSSPPRSPLPPSCPTHGGGHGKPGHRRNASMGNPLLLNECSGGPKKKGHRRRISWGNELIVDPIIHVNEYTPEEKSATWYGPNDLKSFKKERLEVARRIDGGKVTDSDCTRGVEHHTHSGSRIRNKNIVEGVNSVLDEQDLQDMDGKENPELLAHVYRLKTVRSQELARKRALKDELEVIAPPVQEVATVSP
eukprot:Nitzschia sp. Nitz4//scaffold226_size53432//19493//20188//NITZ4_006697-RA/size53432-processed-gene-0.48-mRNA-1//1//CDS//3329542739//6595//frame0